MFWLLAETLKDNGWLQSLPAVFTSVTLLKMFIFYTSVGIKTTLSF